MTNEQGIQILNLILRRAMNGLHLQLVGRNLFDAAAKVDIREYRIELWPGYVTSIRQHEQDVLLCCEIAHKTMRMQTVYDVLNDCRKNSRDLKEAFKREILGCVVLTDYNNKTYRIDDVDFNLSPKEKFLTKDGEITFIDYYKQKYNIRIRDPDQPMLLSRAKKKELRGGQAELMALVPELCKMTGLTDQMRTDFRMMRSMSEHTRLNPDRRIERLLKFNERLQTSSESQEVFKNWQTELDRSLVEFQARQLKPEMIYFSPSTDGVNAGDMADWTFAFRNNPMFSSVALNRWFMIFPERCSREAGDFLRCMQDSARGMRFTIADPTHVRIRDDRPDSYAQALENCANKDPQMIICVVSNNKADRYTTIKKKCCIERGIPTQVLVHKTITPKGGNVRTLMSVATKVVIQLNCKLGGVPWKVKIPMNGIMTIGFDVSHDAQDKSKSFGAMVCTMENDYKAAPKFFSCVSQHQYGEEISNYLSLNVVKAMQEYRQVFGCLPKKIFFYRDGVGEGQLQHVYDHEVSSIRAQLDNIYKTAGITDPVSFAFFVVNKRINTRFFHNKQNPKPGTVVDDVVTLPER
jgi:aubergine-like protein